MAAVPTLIAGVAVDSVDVGAGVAANSGVVGTEVALSLEDVEAGVVVEVPVNA